MQIKVAHINKLAASVKRHVTADIDRVKTEKEKQILTSGQRHTDHIENGQRVSRHSLPTLCFLFFSHPHFLKTILRQPASGTFGFARHTSQTFAKPKEPLFCLHTDRNMYFGKLYFDN